MQGHDASAGNNVMGPQTPFKEPVQNQEKHALPSKQARSSATPQPAAPLSTSKLSLQTQEPARLLTDDISPTSTQFGTPSPFPIRAKRSRSAAAAGAIGASPPSAQPCWTDFQSRAAAAPAFSPITSFPPLDGSRMPSAAAKAEAPRAQRGLFGTVDDAVPVKAEAAGGLATAGRPRKAVVSFGELVVQGLAAQQAAAAGPPSADSATDTDEDEIEDQAEILLERQRTAGMRDAWLERAVHLFSGQGKENAT